MRQPPVPGEQVRSRPPWRRERDRHGIGPTGHGPTRCGVNGGHRLAQLQEMDEPDQRRPCPQHQIRPEEDLQIAETFWGLSARLGRCSEGGVQTGLLSRVLL